MTPRDVFVLNNCTLGLTGKLRHQNNGRADYRWRQFVNGILWRVVGGISPWPGITPWFFVTVLKKTDSYNIQGNFRSVCLSVFLSVWLIRLCMLSDAVHISVCRCLMSVCLICMFDLSVNLIVTVLLTGTKLGQLSTSQSRVTQWRKNLETVSLLCSTNLNASKEKNAVCSNPFEPTTVCPSLIHLEWEKAHKSWDCSLAGTEQKH